MDDFSVPPVEEQPIVEPALEEVQVKAPKKKVQVQYRRVTVAVTGESIYESDGEYYSSNEDSPLVVGDKNDKRFSPLYNWDSEIAGLLPSYEELVANIRHSFYRAGALHKEDMAKPAVRKAALRYAFPYTITD